MSLMASVHGTPSVKIPFPGPESAVGPPSVVVLDEGEELFEHATQTIMDASARPAEERATSLM
jgi:hypothetical protein